MPLQSIIYNYINISENIARNRFYGAKTRGKQLANIPKKQKP
jgi:hypothetical protein